MKFVLLSTLFLIMSCAHETPAPRPVFPENAPVKKFDYEPGVSFTGGNFYIEQTEMLEGTAEDLQVVNEHLVASLKKAGLTQVENPQAAHLRVAYWSRAFSEFTEAQKRLWYFQDTQKTSELTPAEQAVKLKQLTENLAKAQEFVQSNGAEKQYGVTGYVQSHGKRPRLLFSAYLIYGQAQQVSFARVSNSWLWPLDKLTKDLVPANSPKDPGCSLALGYELREEAVANDRPRQFIRSINPLGPAAKAGLQVGDRLVSMNEYPIAAAVAMNAHQYNKFYQGPIRLKIERNGSEQELTLRPAPVCQ